MRKKNSKSQKKFLNPKKSRKKRKKLFYRWKKTKKRANKRKKNRKWKKHRRTRSPSQKRSFWRRKSSWRKKRYRGRSNRSFCKISWFKKRRKEWRNSSGCWSYRKKSALSSSRARKKSWRNSKCSIMDRTTILRFCSISRIPIAFMEKSRAGGKRASRSKENRTVTANIHSPKILIPIKARLKVKSQRIPERMFRLIKIKIRKSFLMSKRTRNQRWNKSRKKLAKLL